MGGNWYTGNAADDADAHRGWLLGHFIDPPGDIRASDAVEIKWGTHPAGQQREAWFTGEQRTTMVILISGRFRQDLSTGSAVLERPGDYVAWGPGIDHSWQALDDSVILTVRWPSVVTG